MKRNMNYPEITTHAILIDVTRKQILLIKWRNPLGEIVWSFPSGHINVGETVKEAVVREVQEETEYLIEVNQLLGVYDNIVRDDSSKQIIAHIINIIWIADILSGTLDFSQDSNYHR